MIVVIAVKFLSTYPHKDVSSILLTQQTLIVYGYIQGMYFTDG